MARAGVDIPPTANLTQGAMPATPTLLLHTAPGDDGSTPAPVAVDRAAGERVGSLGMPGLGMHGMLPYLHEGRRRIVVPISGALVAPGLPQDHGGAHLPLPAPAARAGDRPRTRPRDPPAPVRF